MRGLVRLHIGAGDKRWPGWVNCDANGDQNVVTDCKKLPFDADYADEIQAIHFIEHIPRMEVDNMLFDWHRVLKRGGKLAVEVPSLNRIAKLVLDKEKNIRLTTFGIFGDPRDPRKDMMHAWCYTEEELTEVIRQVGFTDVAVHEPKFHYRQRDMRIEATKP